MAKLVKLGMTHIKIDFMTLLDVDEVVKLEDECFSNPWSRKSILEELNNKNAFFIVGKIDSKVVGYVGMITVAGEGYITNIATTKSMRNKGVATALINRIVEFGKENLNFVTLEVRKSNKKAINLYSKFGFKTVGERRNFYNSPTENAVLMTKHFKT